MQTVLERLGFSADDRVAIVHADDIGMCQATVAAFVDLLEVGLVSSAAVMAPCPWFLDAAAVCRAHPEADMGVHLTITCEWENYRWGPISTRDPASGMLDDQGYFPHSSREIQQQGDPAAIAAEIAAQLDRAIQAGIDVTHVDTHMGSLIHPRFIEAYVELARRRTLPAMLLRVDEAGARARGADEQTAAWIARTARELDEQGVILFDTVTGLTLEDPADRIEVAKRAFDDLPAGLTHFIIHPAKDTPELRAIAPDWRARVADYEAFTSVELRDYVRASGMEIIGYRALREIIRQ